MIRGDELKVMEEKFKKEALETEIKNLKAELVHLNKEYDYCSQAAAESSVKLACICQDYEVNQMALMKKNRSVVGYANDALKCIYSVEQAVNSEKISSKVISAALKTFQQVAKVI